MAVPTGTFVSYSAVGVKEDLANIIYDISPTETPFLTNAKRGRTTQKYTEWQTDSLTAATNVPRIEGDDAVGMTASPTTRWANYCQIMWKVPVVAGTLDVSEKAGRGSELQYQILKRSRELKRDMEYTLLGNQGATAGAIDGARKLAGVGPWLFGNNVAVVTNYSTAPVTSGAPLVDVLTTTSVSALVSSRLNSAIAAAWEDGGDASLVLVNASLKQAISGFTGIATQYRDNPQVGPGVIIGSADTYVSDFGTHYIVADRFMPANNVYCLDMDYWEVAYLRPMQTVELAKTGDAEKRLVLTEFTLKALNPDASAKVSGCS
jgi:hypothetical protein